MVMETKSMGWLQLIVGIIALWAAWSGNAMLGLGALGAAMLVMGYHHLEGKGHKTF